MYINIKENQTIADAIMNEKLSKRYVLIDILPQIKQALHLSLGNIYEESFFSLKTKDIAL